MSWAIITPILTAQVTKDIVLTTVSTTINATSSLISYFINTNNVNINIFKNELLHMDINNNLIIISSLIKDIIHKQSRIEMSATIYLKNRDENDENILLPEPLKKAIFSTYEMIEKIRINLEDINLKITYHEQKYFKNWRNLDLTEEIKILKMNNEIFKNRLNILLKLIKIYNVNKR